MNPLMALLAFAALAGFLGILIWHVPEPDLILVTVAVAAMAGLDVIRTLRGSGK